MRRQRAYFPRISETTCKRCGNAIYTKTKSAYGLDALKQDLGGICENCITPAERREIQNAILAAATGRGLPEPEPQRSVSTIETIPAAEVRAILAGALTRA